MKQVYQEQTPYCEQDTFCQRETYWMMTNEKLKAELKEEREKREASERQENPKINLAGIFSKISKDKERVEAQLGELIEFKKHYEPILKLLEEESRIERELKAEILGMEGKAEPIENVDKFIADKFSFLAENYDDIADW